MQRTRSVSLSRSWSLSILHCSCWICVFNNGRCPDWSLSWVGKWSSNKQILKFLFMNFRQERNYTVGRKKQKQKKTATHRMILQAVAWLWNPEPLRNTPLSPSSEWNLGKRRKLENPGNHPWSVSCGFWHLLFGEITSVVGIRWISKQVWWFRSIPRIQEDMASNMPIIRKYDYIYIYMYYI